MNLSLVILDLARVCKGWAFTRLDSIVLATMHRSLISMVVVGWYELLALTTLGREWEVLVSTLGLINGLEYGAILLSDIFMEGETNGIGTMW